jgi:hypothetical protein
MIIERRLVSRKTPHDGKIEISYDAATQLGSLGAEFPIRTADGVGVARVESLRCTCEKNAGDPHVHHFVESPILRALIPGSEVSVEIDGATAVLRSATA